MRSRVILVTIISLLSSADPAISQILARSDTFAHQSIAYCIRRAAAGRPWLERTLWGLRDQEAGWIGAKVRNQNGSHDLGPLQVNSWWVPRIAILIDRPSDQVSHWLQFDACFNADVARWIFLDALARTHNYWKAVGAYHSPTIYLQEHYVRQVAGRLQKRFGADVFPAR